MSRVINTSSLVLRIAIALAAFVISLAAVAQEEAPSSPPSQEAGTDGPSEQSSENAAPLWQVGPEASEPADQSSDTAPPDPSAAAQEANPELNVVPVTPEPAPTVAESGSPGRLDDLVVTAQKREQGAMDVPISMSVMTEEFIRSQGITDITEALRFVPNFKVIELFNKVTPQCRGFTVDDVNPAFEAPCGVALDGVAYSRASYFSSGLFDIERLEVLRGPQGTTFGKNTTAGVVGLYTKEPTESFTAKADVQYGFEGAAQQRLEAAFGGPLIRDVVNFRVAAMTEERDGYMENTLHLTDSSVPPTIGGRERTSYRARLTFPDVLGSQIKLLHERTDQKSLGLAAKIYTTDDSATADYIRQYDPNADFGENYKTSLLGPQDVPQKQTRTHVEWSAPFNGWDATLLAAGGELSTGYRITPATYPVAPIIADRSERDPFLTGEFRVLSPDFDGVFGLQDVFGWDLGSSRLLAGVFAQRTEIQDLHLHVALDDVAFAGTLGSSIGLFFPDRVFDQLQDQGGINEEEWADLNFDQTAETTAIFGQFTWEMTPVWSLDLAGRVSREAKVGDWNTFYSTPAPLLDTTGDGAFTDHEEISETNFQPKISLGYKLTPEINLFAHWAQAVKSGGFNFYTITGDPKDADPPGKLSYDPETATDVGFDIKTILFDRLRLNLSLFQLNLDDFQVLTEVKGTTIIPAGPTGESKNVPNNYQEVRNAARARAEGAELDVQYLALDWLTATAGIGYNHTNFISFPTASCSGTETPDQETGRCDHSGKGFPNSPELTGALTLDAKFPLGEFWSALGDLEFVMGGTAEYVGETNFDGAEGPCCVREPYWFYRAQMGFGKISQGWTFRVIGLNLADEYLYASRVQGEDLQGDPFTVGVPLPPRTVFGQLSWTFY
jgi:iron complex outermembrane recepter protein